MKQIHLNWCIADLQCCVSFWCCTQLYTWIYTYIFKLNFLFLTNCRSQEIAKLAQRGTGTHLPASPNGSILHNYSIISKPGNWHCNPQTLPLRLRHHHFYMHLFVCVYEKSTRFHHIFVDLYNYRQNQDTELFPHHKDPVHKNTAKLIFRT